MKNVFVKALRNTVADKRQITMGEIYSLPESEATKLVLAGKGEVVPDDEIGMVEGPVIDSLDDFTAPPAGDETTPDSDDQPPADLDQVDDHNAKKQRRRRRNLPRKRLKNN